MNKFWKTISLNRIRRWMSPLRAFRKGSVTGKPRVLIVGTQEGTQEFLEELDPYQGSINIMGIANISFSRENLELIYLGKVLELADLIQGFSIDEVIFILPGAYVNKIEKYVQKCEEMGVIVRIMLDLYDLKIASLSMTKLGKFQFLIISPVKMSGYQRMAKRFVDIVGSLMGLLFLSVISIFVIVAIKLDSPGKGIFTQDRVGLNGRKFKFYKFRSMFSDADFLKKQLEDKNAFSDGRMFKMEKDPRITRLGKFLRRSSLDEIPQFINVLKGDMSLVGPRPPTQEEIKKYDHYHRRRLSVKPGITGLWQVSGRSEITNFEEVLKLDTQYIDEWSLCLDFKIILKTFRAVLKRKGAY